MYNISCLHNQPFCCNFATSYEHWLLDAYELAYEYVLHTGRCIFLTGKAGTGKTTFLRRLRVECPKQMAVVAPTGVAAINAEGVTIHSLFQLPPQVFLPTTDAYRQLFAEMQMRGQKQRVLRNLELLIIDEISMVRADLLDAIDAVLRHFKHRPNIPFGGTQILFIGDLFQLSPVAREEEWGMLRNYYTGPYFFQAHVFEQLKPIYIELDHVFRQTNQTFINILNQVRNNTLSSTNRNRLNQRYIPDFNPHQTPDEPYITLSTHNRKVDAINQQEMALLGGQQFTFHAKVKDTFPESMFPIEQTLTLKLGARVMFVKNDSSPLKQYYNGKLGLVTALDKQHIQVTCDDKQTIDVHTETWENIRYTADAESQNIQSEVIGTFCQFPLKLAWAITIHKAQGLTFDRVVIDAADAFAAGQVYVALSRCRSLEGIVLLTPIPEHALTNAPEVLNFTAQQLTLNETAQQLQPAQNDYLTGLICSLFDFKTPLNLINALRNAADKMDSIQGDTNAFFTPVIHSLEELQTIGEKFQNQLRNILYNNDLPLLQQRLHAADSYFSPRLDTLAQTLSQCPLRSNNHLDATYLRQGVIDIYTNLIRITYIQSNITHTPTIKHYLYLRTQCPTQIPEIHLYTEQRKARKSAAKHPIDSLSEQRKHTNTELLSYALFLQGKSVEQIAKERHLSKRTIIKHLTAFRSYI